MRVSRFTFHTRRAVQSAIADLLVQKLATVIEILAPFMFLVLIFRYVLVFLVMSGRLN